MKTKQNNLKTCSVIIPVYNAEPFLASCLCSISAQTYSALQVIIVDDGSSDHSAAIAQSFCDADSRFMLVKQVNQGQGSARNNGLNHAIGEFIMFVDADDTLDTEYIEQHVLSIGNYDMTQAGYQRVREDGIIIETRLPRHKYQFTSPCMRLYRREWLRPKGILFPVGMIYEDVIFSLRVWAAHPSIIFVPSVGYRYLLNPHSTTSTKSSLHQQKLYHAIRETKAPLWLKLYTRLRLFIHFLKS